MPSVESFKLSKRLDNGVMFNKKKKSESTHTSGSGRYCDGACVLVWFIRQRWMRILWSLMPWVMNCGPESTADGSVGPGFGLTIRPDG